MNENERKADLIEALIDDRRLTKARLGAVLLKRLPPHRTNAYDHAHWAVEWMVRRKYIIRVKRGLYQLTDLGAAWCGADNVANVA